MVTHPKNVCIYIGHTTRHVALSSQTRDHDPVFGVLTTGLPGKSPTSVNEASSLSLTKRQWFRGAKPALSHPWGARRPTVWPVKE